MRQPCRNDHVPCKHRLAVFRAQEKGMTDLSDVGDIAFLCEWHEPPLQLQPIVDEIAHRARLERLEAAGLAPIGKPDWIRNGYIGAKAIGLQIALRRGARNRIPEGHRLAEECRGHTPAREIGSDREPVRAAADNSDFYLIHPV